MDVGLLPCLARCRTRCGVKLEFTYPLVLLLLPLALLPFFRTDRQALSYGWLRLLPRDTISEILGLVLKLVAAGAIAAVIVGLSDRKSVV